MRGWWVRFVIFYFGFPRGSLRLRLDAKLLDFEQVRESAGIMTAEARFEAMVDLECLRFRLRGEMSDGPGEAGRFRDELAISFEIGLLAAHFHVEGSGFGAPIAADAPVGEGHFLDETGFGPADGLEPRDEVVEKGFPVCWVFIAEEKVLDVAAVADGVL